MAKKLTLALTLALALAAATSLAKHVTIDAHLHRGSDPTDIYSLSTSRFRAALQGTNKAFTIEPATFPKHSFWYGLFDVGASKNLRLILDTGSPGVQLNPGRYKPSSQAVNLHTRGNASYFGTMPDGCGYLKIDYELYNDSISAQSGLTVKNQLLLKTLKTKSSPDSGIEAHTASPFEGVVGFDYSNVDPSGLSFFGNACEQKQVDECRFGMAFGMNGTGKAILGGLDKSLFTGRLTNKSLQNHTEWVINGSVAVNGKIIEGHQSYTLDTGTANVLGWLPSVQKLFNETGIQGVEQDIAGCGKVLFGYYPCDKPPTVGFTVGSKVFNIDPSVFALKDNGKNNCTSTIVGADGLGLNGAGEWILGQVWMQGKYLDFDVTGSKVGIAPLRDT